MRKTALKRCKLKRCQVNSNYQGCIYSNQCRSAYGNMQVCTTAIRISSTAHKSHSYCPVRETDRLHWSFVSLFWLIYEVVNRRVLPWRDMLFAVPLACVLNSWSCRYKPLRWTHPAPPPPLWACVCVCVCGGRPGNEKSWTVTAWENDFRAGWYQHKSSHMHTAESFQAVWSLQGDKTHL